MSATTRTTFFGSSAAIRVMASAQRVARRRRFLSRVTRTAMRLRFSINARRSMIGTAHNSPRLSGTADW